MKSLAYTLLVLFGALTVAQANEKDAAAAPAAYEEVAVVAEEVPGASEEAKEPKEPKAN